jgi:hypothetical protein
MESFETPRRETKESDVSSLVSGFLELPHTHDSDVFEDLEDVLGSQGFELAGTFSVSDIFYDNALLCRSESFTKVMELLLEDRSIELESQDNDANLCRMASGKGFRVAMEEGFSGKDVSNSIKAVLVFKSTHITSHDLSKDKDLWALKPQTASVSQAGSGSIEREDVAMVSFRFPIHLFPEHLLSETEKENLELSKTKFVVRHYILKNKITMH